MMLLEMGRGSQGNLKANPHSVLMYAKKEVLTS